MTTERLRRRLEALAPADSWPTVWHELTAPEENMPQASFEAWQATERAKIPPGEGVIFCRIVSPAGWPEGGRA